MVIKASGSADNKNLQPLLDMLDNWTVEVLDLAEETFRDLQPDLLADFQKQPPVRRWPQDYPGNVLPFDSEKQRRWYWANVGQPYTRSGGMAQNLKQDIERKLKSIAVIASYPGASTKYVIGNIHGESVESFQQRFHKATGWEEAAPKLTRHAQLYSDTFLKRYESFIAFFNR